MQQPGSHVWLVAKCDLHGGAGLRCTLQCTLHGGAGWGAPCNAPGLHGGAGLECTLQWTRPAWRGWLGAPYVEGLGWGAPCSAPGLHGVPTKTTGVLRTTAWRQAASSSTHLQKTGWAQHLPSAGCPHRCQCCGQPTPGQASLVWTSWKIREVK